MSERVGVGCSIATAYVEYLPGEAFRRYFEEDVA